MKVFVGLPAQCAKFIQTALHMVFFLILLFSTCSISKPIGNISRFEHYIQAVRQHFLVFIPDIVHYLVTFFIICSVQFCFQDNSNEKLRYLLLELWLRQWALYNEVFFFYLI